ncbi:hypothetical protein EJB05_41507 [Eragrostis curvula]|uniref:Uncharacterized protein n=1 Tax=Eragrostis curvula TaxID=38414 RepID=A0A5J9T9W4_9POAL|nr:hypothetical protein EJB05_41507 [Eragrostis curvula]
MPPPSLRDPTAASVLTPRRRGGAKGEADAAKVHPLPHEAANGAEGEEMGAAPAGWKRPEWCSPAGVAAWCGGTRRRRSSRAASSSSWPSSTPSPWSRPPRRRSISASSPPRGCTPPSPQGRGSTRSSPRSTRSSSRCRRPTSCGRSSARAGPAPPSRR